MNFLEKITRLVYPPKCIFCGSLLEAGAGADICSLCYSKVPFLNGPLQTIEIEDDIIYCDGVISACKYSGIVQQSLIRYKFFNKPGYYRVFAGFLAKRLSALKPALRADMVLSVPLHGRREYDRGYNQAYLISKMLSRQLGLPECTYLVQRTRHTGTQSLLNRSERRMNIKGAFRVTMPEAVRGKTILLVDDIMTTGFTLNECSRALKEAGAEKVVGAVVAEAAKPRQADIV